jgi:hypothetical protein
MVCTAKVSIRLLRIEKLVRGLWESTNLFTANAIDDVDGETLFKTGNVKGDAFSVIPTRFAAVIWVYIPQNLVLTSLELCTRDFNRDTRENLANSLP